jgi:hypothetical protein
VFVATAWPVNAAVTVTGAVMVSVHGPVPEHAPPNPRNVCPACGVGVSVTVLPLRKPTAQLLPQLRPPMSLVTVPAPVLETVSVMAGAKAASTVVSAVIVTEHVPVPSIRRHSNR